MYRIAAIGDKDSIYGFAALGLDVVFTDENDVNAAKKFRKLAEGEYAVIYITEPLAQRLEKEIAGYRECQIPAIIPIPGTVGNTGAGIASVKKSVEQAVGSDILFSNR